MASIRQLKKNLNYLTNELINECFVYQYFNNNKDNEKVEKALKGIVDAHNDLIYRIHHCNCKKNPKMVKAYYRQIINDFKKGIEILDELAKE